MNDYSLFFLDPRFKIQNFRSVKVKGHKIEIESKCQIAKWLIQDGKFSFNTTEDNVDGFKMVFCL